MIFSVNTARSRRGKEELEKQLTLFEKTRPTAVAEMMDGRAGGIERMTTASAAEVRRWEGARECATRWRRSDGDRDGWVIETEWWKSDRDATEDRERRDGGMRETQWWRWMEERERRSDGGVRQWYGVSQLITILKRKEEYKWKQQYVNGEVVFSGNRVWFI